MDYEKQKSDYLKLTDDKSEKELLQLIAFYNKNKMQETERIRRNVVFFFWLSILSIIAAFLLLNQ
jgi:hypothetical protein